MRNPKESSYCPEAGGRPEQRTVSCPHDSLLTGGPGTGDTPPSRILHNSVLQLQSITPFNNAILPITTGSPSTTPVYNTASIIFYQGELRQQKPE
jgi:hypothetical protein